LGESLPLATKRQRDIATWQTLDFESSPSAYSPKAGVALMKSGLSSWHYNQRFDSSNSTADNSDL
jgi:hypothetical protein